MKSAALVVSTIIASSSGAFADPIKTENANSNNGGGKQYELVDGTSFSNAGSVFQHLRERDNGYAAGNPKEVVEAYPEEFKNAGDLIHQKRVEE